MNLKEEYLKLLGELIEATESGKLNWKKQNPTTVFIETSSNAEKAIMSLQKVIVRGPVKVAGAGIQRVVKRDIQTNFVFMVRNASNNELVVQIDSAVDQTFNGKLNELFEACEFSSEKKNMDFLKGIIDNIGGDKLDQ